MYRRDTCSRLFAGDDDYYDLGQCNFQAAPVNSSFRCFLRRWEHFFWKTLFFGQLHLVVFSLCDFWYEKKTSLNPYSFWFLGSLYLHCGSDATLDAVASLAGLRIMLEVHLTAQSKINSVKIFPGSR